MAVQHYPALRLFQVTAQGDIVSGPVDVRALGFVCTTTGSTAVRIHGAAGPRIYIGTPTADRITWPASNLIYPIKVYDLCASILPAGVYLWVHY
jgi:hypothetical protein